MYACNLNVLISRHLQKLLEPVVFGHRIMLVTRSSLVRECRLALALLLPLAIRIAATGALLLVLGGHRLSGRLPNAACDDDRLVSNAAHDGWGIASGNLSLVLQVSDVHTSRYSDSNTSLSLANFLDHHAVKWKSIANAVIITGDLVDAKLRMNPGISARFGYRSKQHDVEWFALRTALNRSVIRTIVVPGNHDTFGGSSPPCDISGIVAHACGNDVQRFDVAPGLSIIALDATPSIALHAPLNFFGQLRKSAYTRIDTALRNISVQRPHAMTLLVNHYPASTLVGARNLESLNGISALLSGHLHTLYGAAPSGLLAISRNMRVDAQMPHLSTRIFRVIAVDHGVLSLHDVQINRQNSLNFLVLNPPSRKFCTPGAVAAARRSAFIRFIALEEPLGPVSVHIDGVRIAVAQRVCDTAPCSSVFRVPWNASAYDDADEHLLQLRGKNDDILCSHYFSLRGNASSRISAYVIQTLHAIMALTPFDELLSSLSVVALVACGVLIALLARQPSSQTLYVPLALYVPNLIFGYVLVSQRLTGEQIGGFVGFFIMRTGGEILTALPDVHLCMGGSILWNALLPLITLVYLHSRGCKIFSSVAGIVAVSVLVVRAISWTISLSISYGGAAALLSPSALPFLALVLWSVRSMRDKTRFESRKRV